MRVLVLSNFYPPDVMGGYELGCRQVVDALKGRGHEVRVLTSIPRGPTPTAPGVHRTLRLADVWSDYQFRRSAAATAHLTQHESHRLSAANVHTLLAEVEDFRPDVAYPWMLAGLGGLGLMAALQHVGVPWAWHLMDDVPVLLCTAAGRLVPTFAREFTGQFRGHFLACSRQVVDEIEAAGVPLGGPVELLPNWVEDPRGPVRTSYLQGGVLRVASAAGLIERRVDKGIDVLIEAAARLRGAGVDRFEIDIYGNVADEYFPSLIHRHDVAGQVRLMGPRSQAELAGLYADYDVFAFPTRPREPFGFAPLEAAAAGCVPLISATCGIAEWFVHGVHVLKAPRTAADFARTLAEVHAGRIDLAPIGRRLAAVVRREFALDAIMPRIEAILARAAASATPALGPPAEAYRLAILAEKLARVMIQEALVA